MNLMSRKQENNSKKLRRFLQASAAEFEDLSVFDEFIVHVRQAELRIIVTPKGGYFAGSNHEYTIATLIKRLRDLL